jgi:hypothetical protein
MREELRNLVWNRAGSRCEYCCMPQQHDDIPFEVDHVIAVSHGGTTRASNLSLACFHCNSFKGPNLAGIDPNTNRVTPLFHPRRHKWDRHFRWHGAILVGRTAIGRATIATLRINLPLRVDHRAALIEEGAFP